MAKITYDQYIRASRNWDTYVGASPSVWPSLRNGVDDFLNWNNNEAQWAESGTYRNVTVPDYTIEKFNILASPHFRTLLKAYEAKTGIKIKLARS